MQKIDYQIEGAELQMLTLNLQPKQSVSAETGAMVFMQESIMMQTNTGGGLFSGVKRMLGGGGLFLTHFENQSSNQNAKIGFAAPYPGKIIPIDLNEHGGELLAHKDSFLCSSTDTKIEVALTKRFSSGLFGGDGFILQKLTGRNLAFIHAGGTLIKHTLSHGEVLKVDTGALAAFEASVAYEVTFVKGIANMLFGGEGMFFTKLTGPGKVYLQSMPLAKLAHCIGALLPPPSK